MRFKAPAIGVLAAASLCAAPVAANAASTSPSTGPILSGSAPCAAPGGFAQVQQGQSLAQVQQEMGSTGDTADTSTQGGFTREEVTWRNCQTLVGQTGVLTYGVTFYGTPTTPLTENSKTSLAIGTTD